MEEMSDMLSQTLEFLAEEGGSSTIHLGEVEKKDIEGLQAFRNNKWSTRLLMCLISSVLEKACREDLSDKIRPTRFKHCRNDAILLRGCNEGRECG